MNNSVLFQLKQWTRIVADTGNLHEINQWKPEEATTNPTLVLKALQEDFTPIKEAYLLASEGMEAPTLQSVWMACLVIIGERILNQIPYRLSIEVDARSSFDTTTTVQNALKLVQAFSKKGLDSKRLLIKIAATWEGIRAAEILEKKGIACNVTLVFHKIQALACAQAGVTLISPFVGRIYDWYKARNLPMLEDPGVASVKAIYYLLKSQGYTTEIMGASFRTVEQIIALAGCDRLTISPKLLDQLNKDSKAIKRQLICSEKIELMQTVTEEDFRWQLNSDPMATEKLAEGIRLFARDGELLEQLIINYLTENSLPLEG